MRLEKLYSFGTRIWRVGLILLVLILTGCKEFPAANQSPPYEPPHYVVPTSWHGAGLLIEANPANDERGPP